MDTEEAEKICTEAVRIITNPCSGEDLSRAAKLFSSAADAGYSQGMFGLAEMKLQGIGMERDVNSAVELYQKAADLGNVSAMFRLGQVSSIEFHDDVKAFGWYSKCAEAGFSPAYPALGDCYYDGVGTKIDAAKAIELYQKGVESGDPTSCLRMGCIYSEGTEVPKDQEKADLMFLLAAKAGIPEAQFLIATGAYEGRIPGGKELAAEWFSRCADVIPTACFNLATMYINGDGVAKDTPKAFGMFKKLAETGDADAMFQTGKMLLAGEGVKQDPQCGFEYICKAAEAGNADAAMVVESLHRRQNRQFIKIDGTE